MWLPARPETASKTPGVCVGGVLWAAHVGISTLQAPWSQPLPTVPRLCGCVVQGTRLFCAPFQGNGA